MSLAATNGTLPVPVAEYLCRPFEGRLESVDRRSFLLNMSFEFNRQAMHPRTNSVEGPYTQRRVLPETRGPDIWPVLQLEPHWR
jgi:hypothetical protein